MSKLSEIRGVNRHAIDIADMVVVVHSHNFEILKDRQNVHPVPVRVDRRTLDARIDAHGTAKLVLYLTPQHLEG